VGAVEPYDHGANFSATTCPYRGKRKLVALLGAPRDLFNGIHEQAK
jgi:hypothetical protein